MRSTTCPWRLRDPEQLGPLRTARAFAIVHIAIFDAVNAIVGGYKSYTGLSPARKGASMHAAIAQAAHDTLVELFPSQTKSFDALLAEDLSKIHDGRAKKDGIDLGRQAAAAILALRANDGSQHDEELYGDRVHACCRAGQVAPRPDQSDSDRAGCPLGRVGYTVRPDGRPISSRFRLRLR